MTPEQHLLPDEFKTMGIDPKDLKASEREPESLEPKVEAGMIEQERSEVEACIRAAVARNREVMDKTPDSATDDEYWDALRREGQPTRLVVRRLEGETADVQEGMYLLSENGGEVEMTYFQDDGSAGKRFWMKTDRIVLIK